MEEFSQNTDRLSKLKMQITNLESYLQYTKKFNILSNKWKISNSHMQ